MGVLCSWVKLLTELQIWGCELHKNAFDDPLGSYSAAASPLAVTRGGEREREEKGWE